ncbi:MAG: proton-conducting transporter membrane subunit, partial [Armatimonadota bacterium]|nr:proton-conducting transporter membrane subunit [Armatimonadota bacterium]
MITDYIWLVPGFPLLGAFINGVFGRWLPRAVVAVVACATVAGSFVVSVAAYLALARLPAAQQSHVSTLYTWIASGSFRADVSALVDPLSVFMMLVVSGVGFLIHVYSAGYMGHDPRFSRYFAFLNLFMFSMLLLVLADSFLTVFVAWELVGLCSYLLIGFWYRKRSAALAAKKAFIVNRVGDVGFALGIMLIFVSLGTLDIREVIERIGELDGGTITVISLLIFAGAMG